MLSFIDNGEMKNIIESPNTIDISYLDLDEVYLLNDLHLLKECLTKTYEGDKEDIRISDTIEDKSLLHTKAAIRIAETVPKDKTLLFLGDLTESEYNVDLDIWKHISSTIKNKVTKISSKGGKQGLKILVKGNNDTLSDDVYKKLGFDIVCSKAVWKDKLMFTHKPINNTTDAINIHGHLHEGNVYRDTDCKNHINSYWKHEINGKLHHLNSAITVKWLCDNSGELTKNNTSTVTTSEYDIGNTLLDTSNSGE